jgi:hypothetical protein
MRRRACIFPTASPKALAVDHPSVRLNNIVLSCLMNYRISTTSAVGTERTNRAGPLMSVPRGNPEVAFRERQDRC